jgi:hypothetical protein
VSEPAPAPVPRSAPASPFRKKDEDAAPRGAWAVVVDPAGAFAGVRARPRPWLFLLVVAAFALLPPLSFLSRADTVQVVTRELKKSGRYDDIPAATRADVIAVSAKAMTVALPVGAVVKRTGALALLALFAWGLLRARRPELTFKSCLAAAALGAAPLCFSDVGGAVIYAVRDLQSIDAQNPLLSNPAAWLQQDSQGSVVAALLRGLDLFELWGCALIAYGINATAGVRSAVPWALTFGLHTLSVAASVIGVAAR